MLLDIIFKLTYIIKAILVVHNNVSGHLTST